MARIAGIVGWMLVALSVSVDLGWTQERSFTVTLSESNWNNVARIVSKSKDLPWEDTNPILSSIAAQIRQQLERAEQERTENGKLRFEVQRLQDELKRLLDAQKPPAPPAIQ